MYVAHFFLLLCAGVYGAGDPDTPVADLTWTPTNAPRGPAVPALTPFRDGYALRFNRNEKTRLDLGQAADGRLRLAGPLSLEAVFQLETTPPGKVSLISKWQTRNGGRSYELGVTPFGWVFFTISASGNWDARAAELLSNQSLQTGIPYHVVAVYEPGERMALFINGVSSGELTKGVPESVFDSPTPIWLGNRFGGESACAFEGLLASGRIYASVRGPRAIAARATTLGLEPIPIQQFERLESPYDLDQIKARAQQWYARLQAPDQQYGAYRLTPARPADLYASADIAWIRWMMDDLELSSTQRRQWIDFLQDQQNPEDGTYRHITGHCPAHAFCHATGALNMLGGRQRYAPKFLRPYLNVKQMSAWLDDIDWVQQWGASHDIWGAGLPLACSPETPAAWREALFAWLDAEADPATGFWRRGVEARSPLEYLGGAFHIWPVYAALDRPLPYPDQVIDHVLDLEQPDGSFDRGFGYGNMDGVWVLQYLSERTPHRRQDNLAALGRNLNGLMRLYNQQPARFFTDAHGTESRMATLAILQAALPKEFRSSKPWRNPWHQSELFRIEVD